MYLALKIYNIFVISLILAYSLYRLIKDKDKDHLIAFVIFIPLLIIAIIF